MIVFFKKRLDWVTAFRAISASLALDLLLVDNGNGLLMVYGNVFGAPHRLFAIFFLFVVFICIPLSLFVKSLRIYIGALVFIAFLLWTELFLLRLAMLGELIRDGSHELMGDKANWVATVITVPFKWLRFMFELKDWGGIFSFFIQFIFMAFLLGCSVWLQSSKTVREP